MEALHRPFLRGNMSNLYHSIGKTKIENCIRDFYTRAFSDPLISHFFFNSSLEDLVSAQINFFSILMGSKDHKYEGPSIKKAHHKIPIKKVHFDRRLVLLREVLVKQKLSTTHIDSWVGLEESFRNKIITDPSPCNH